MSNNDFFDYLAENLSKSDVYAAKAIGEISAYIINYRVSNGLSQKEFAEMMGVTQSMVSKWESAEYNFTVEAIAKIAEKLQCTFEINFVPEHKYYNSVTTVSNQFFVALIKSSPILKDTYVGQEVA